MTTVRMTTRRRAGSEKGTINESSLHALPLPLRGLARMFIEQLNMVFVRWRLGATRARILPSGRLLDSATIYAVPQPCLTRIIRSHESNLSTNYTIIFPHTLCHWTGVMSLGSIQP